MKNLALYRIASYILIPIGAFLGFICLIALMIAMSNVGMLFTVFTVGSTVLYIFLSFSFQQRLQRNMPMKTSAKDWIKVNAYVALFFAGMGIINAVAVISNPGMVQEIMSKMLEAQPATGGQKLELASIMKIVRGMMYGFLFLSIVLIYHITVTLKLVKKYTDLFKL